MLIDGSTPLNRLPLAVIDLETTGLNVATDRIVQLGGIAMQGARILEDQVFNRLVNPGIPISQKISKIHNITDNQVKGQPPYSELHLDFHNFLQKRIVVGFNIGFDLAILRNETERLKLKPNHYRYLDVRMLGLILSLPSEILYLESLAEYYGLDSENRHDALGDSIITANILAKFIPLLREKKILTLGEAERLCQEKMDFLTVSYARDWYYPIPMESHSLPIREQKWTQLERIDPFPFSHTVSEFMATELLTIPENCTVGQAAEIMSEKKIGSILIHAQNDHQDIIGIFTERDLLNYFGKTSGEKNHPIKELMKHPIKQISENALLFQAIQTMVEGISRHLLVTGSEGKPVGIISQRDFLKSRLENFYRNQFLIESINSVPQLAALHEEIPVLARRLLKEELSPDKIAQVISSECGIIVKKACELALEKIQEEKGDVPCPFSVLILGSAGRGESLLSFDQDNAIIYEEDGEENQQWFLTFGQYLNDILNTAGIPYCNGGVMAGKEKWCRSLNSWKERIREWFTSSEPEAILNADIFVDFIHAFGEERLTSILQQELNTLSQSQRTFLKLMGEEIIGSTSPPLSLFGNIKTEQGKLDMKATLLFPIVSTARLLALKIGFSQFKSTGLRYQAALAKLKLNDYEIEIIIEAHRLALSMMLEHQLNRISLGQKPDNYVMIKTFNKRAVENLREHLPYLEGLKTVIQDAITQPYNP